MASFQECLDAAVLAGKMTREDAEEAMAFVRTKQRDYAAFMNMSDAEIAAAEKAAAIMLHQAKLKQRRDALQILASKRNDGHIGAHALGKTAGVLAKLVKDRRFAAPYDNVQDLWLGWEGFFHGRFAEAMNWMRPKFAGIIPEKWRQRDFIDAAYARDASPEARAAVEAWTERVAEPMRQRLNHYGADIPEKENWRVPQSWDAATFQRAFNAGEKRKVIADFDGPDVTVRDPLDGTEATGLRRAELLDQMFESVRTDGLNKLVPGQAGGTKLANRLHQRRVIEINTPEKWWDLHEKYGTTDVYHALMEHVREGSRAIARMQVLGPNPTAEARRLADIARQGKALEGKQPGLWQKVIIDTDNQLSGTANSPVSKFWANFFGGARNLVAAARLGKAGITSLTDEGFIRAVAPLAGLDATRILGNQLKLLNPANAADRMIARRLSAIANHWQNEGMMAHRLMDDVAGWGKSGIDTFHKITGLTPLTQARRDAFALEWWGTLGDQQGKAFGELDPALRTFFENSGFAARDWDAVRAAPLMEHDGIAFMAPERIAESGDIETAVRLNAMLHGLLDRAVPTPDALDRAIATLGTRKGTFEGEFIRNTFLFKTFAITVAGNHLVPVRAIVNDKAYSSAARGAYLANLVVTTTFMSAVALQFKEIAVGRDPRDMADARFWGQAFLQSGALAIYGDLLYAGATRGDHSPIESLSPMAGLAADIFKIIGGNAQAAAMDRKTNAIAETINFVHRYMPGSSLFYLDLAGQRLVRDQAQMALDPNWPRSFRNQIRRAQKDWNQKYWWQPGDALPARAPNIDASIGGSP